MTYKSTDSIEIRKAEEWLNQYWKNPSGVEYYHARSVDEAVGLMQEYGNEAVVISGGTDLLGLMKNRVVAPRAIVNLKNIPGLNNIRENENGLELGALVLINGLQRAALIKNRYPALFEAACAIASPQIRNMASVAGNLLQDVRCWYYRRSPDTGITYNCRRKSQAGCCFAMDGENQYHSIFGVQKCAAVCGSDLATVLLALNAKVQTLNAQGGRSCGLDELYTPLGKTLQYGEIVTGIQVPAVSSETLQRFLKFRVRKTIDFAVVSVAASLTMKGEVVKDARIVLGGVAHKPWRVREAEEILLGERITEPLALKAAGAALREASPLKKNNYKVTIAQTLVKRAILGET